MTTVLLVLVVLLLTKTAISQSNTSVNCIDVPNHCGGRVPRSNFINNRNFALDELRMQLFSKRVLYARAQNSSGGDPVFAEAQCRNYLTVDRCVGCFDVAVFNLVKCIDGNGANVFLDDCSVRYEASADFYNNPNVNEDGTGGGFSICGNVSASQPLSSYTQIVDDLLSDIRDATPKTSNSYVASLRRITYENATVYAITQCAENINQDICQGCMNTAYNKLKECLPNTEGKYFDNACFARYSETPLFNDNQTIDITNILKGVHSNKVAIIVGAIGGLVLLFLIFVLCLFRGRKNSKKAGQEDLKGTLNYDYKDLQLATNNFSKENILGKGGFGEVYKAIIDDKNVVAVKKLHVQDVRAKEEFENEVKLISNIHHRNLLRLLGWSSEGSDLFLVLEYMANSSLDQFLWGAKNGTLDWNQRYEIILGIAKGLTHLHSECHVKIIHRDIKSSNILLSDDFKAKIADFGLAMFQPEDETHVNTKFAGTLGYAAPEYVLHGALSNKAWKLYEKKIHRTLIDESLDLNQSQEEHVMKITEIALLCTQSPASNRPTMSEVVLMLQEDQSLGKRQLTRPTFIHNQDRRIHILGS
ncbi:putative protein kinase RLK-Pelle-DLSV family [Helianthus annuus]|nr:putative protein kinase RLK-Pelle-DLSV family [Helianthus annuus]KAJ0562924.1 putative protein kinase RLK-Pelle-DLSV family [Helianthus annuus]KAJ0731063.1 putative protein kinase RLK-Pelle-DLSV family [Helianthus annuus]